MRGRWAYIGLGPSEFRILMVARPFVAQITGVDGMASDSPSRLDTVILILAAFAVIGIAAKALADAREIAAGERRYSSAAGFQLPHKCTQRRLCAYLDVG
jgi:hypothetical protein